MKHEKTGTFLAACAVGMLLGVCVPGCLLTAFDLPVSDPARLLLGCALAAAVWAGLFSLPYGGSVFVCAGGAALLWLWREGSLPGQLLRMLQLITGLYDRAYGWGIPVLPETGEALTDLPLLAVGILTGSAGAWCLCRQGSTWLPAAAAVLPLSLCVVVTDTVPREVYLLGVLLALSLLLITGMLRQENGYQSLRLLAGATIPVTLALAVLFLALPRDGYDDPGREFRESALAMGRKLPGLLENGAETLASRLTGGEAERVDLEKLGRRAPFSYPVMEVTSTRGGPLYLRGQDYDRYTGLAWESSGQRKETFCLTGTQTDTLSIVTGGELDCRYLPYYPAQAETLTGGTLQNRENTRHYSVTRGMLPEDWRLQVYRPEEGQQLTGGPEGYLELPHSTRAGAEQILQNLPLTGSATEIADRIAAFSASHGRYDLDTAPMPGEEPDFALWFLTEAESGYCVHYATAATVLLRAAGVAARYVTGYMVDTPPGEPVQVTGDHAHAWAEYYEPILGVWIPLEVTPAQLQSPESGAAEQTEAAPATRPQEESVPAPSSDTAQTLPQIPLPAGEEPEKENTGTAGAYKALKTAVLLLLVWPVMAVQRSIRLKLRRRKMYTGPVNRQALARWREAERLARLLKESPTEELLVLAQKAKFSRHRLTREELELFDSFHRSCLRRLKERGLHRQLIYRYVYAAY